MSDDLPMGWVSLPLELVGMPSTPNIDPSKFPNEIFELYSVPSYADDEPEILSSNEIHSTKQSVQTGDVLLCKIVPHLNRVWIVKELLQHRQIASGEWIVIRSKIAISDYLRYALTESKFRSDFMATSSGVGGSLMRARPKAVAQIPIPIAPLNEQRRIVDKLDRIGDRQRSARNELSHIPKLIARYKQAVLAAACSGKLTEDWREKNPNVESASILLKQIQERRNKEYEKASLLAASKSRRKPKSVDNSEFEDFEFDFSENLDLPESWSLCNCKMLADLITDGEHATPVRTEDGIFLLSARNVQNGFLSLEKVDYIPDYEYERITKRCNPETNDILISCSGSVGRVCRVPDNVKFTLVRSVALIKLQYNLELSEYLELALQSTISQSQILKLQKATAQANLFIGQIGKIVILLPPLEEQKEIVRRVEKVFAKIDKMEEEYQKAVKLCDRLEQATLAKAFRGELVPQDPDDEPASVLLEQVKREKEKGKKGK